MCCEHQALYTFRDGIKRPSTPAVVKIPGRRYFIVYNYYDPDRFQMFYHEDRSWCAAEYWKRGRWNSNLAARTVPLPMNMVTIALGMRDVL